MLRMISARGVTDPSWIVYFWTGAGEEGDGSVMMDVSWLK